MNSGLPVLEAVSQDKFDEVFRLAGINIGTLIQEYIIADDPEFVIEKYNNMWERAKEKWERAKEKANK
jgi:raffinose/stachyose/melibiose transport system substrate-binding protein